MADEMNMGSMPSGGGNNRPGVMRRIGQISLGGLQQTGSSYFSNITNLKADADTIKTQLIQDGKSVADVFNRFKNNSKSPGKKIRDWFYTDDMMFGGFDSDNDDFDAGFKIDDASSEGESTPRTLDVESMTDIAKKQASEAHKVAAKQAEMSMANTAEIVSAINSRSAELTASINKVNDTLVAITKTLDKVYNIQAQVAKRQEESQVFDYNGQLSAAGIFNAARTNFKDDKLGGLDFAKMIFKSLTPKSLAAMGMDKLFSIEIPGMDGKSVKDIASGINDSIGNAIQSGLMSLIKSDTFVKWFGDVGGHRQGTDYAKYATNQYNTKPAVFDGMTRQTIIHIIPEYLKSIEAAITGGSAKSIDERGRLTTKNENHFQNTIQKSLFSSSTYALSDMNFTRSIVRSHDDSLKSEDIRLVVDAIKTGFEIQIEVSDPKHRGMNANGVVQPKELDPSYHSPRWELAVQYAVTALSGTKMHTNALNGWKEIIYAIFSSMDDKDRTTLANEITRDAATVSKNLMAFAATSPFADQAGKVSADLVINAFRNRVNDVKKYVTPSVTSQTPVNKANEGRIDVPNISGGLGNLQGNQNIPKLMVGELDAIRQILSNGLNVYITGMASSSDERDSVYDSSFSSDSLNSFGSRLGIGIDFFSTQPAAPGRKKKNLFNLSRRKMKSVRGSSGVDIPVNIDQEVISMSDLRNADDYLTAAEMLRSGEARAEDEQDKASILRTADKIKAKREKKERQKNQTTAQNIRENVGNVKDTVSDVYDEAIESLVNSRDPQKVLIGLGMNGVRDKAKSSKLIGTVTEQGGKVVDYVGGKADSAKSFLGGKIEALGGWINNKESQKMAEAMGKADPAVVKQVIQAAFDQSNDLVNNTINTGSEKEQADAKNDQIILQQIHTYIQGAGENGFTAKEVQDVQKLVQQIHNKTAKQNMLRYTIPMLKANSPEIKEKEETKKGGSILGNFIKGSGRYISLFFKPVTLLLGTGLKLLGTISGLILKISGALIKSGAKDIYYGARSVAGGIFGSKKEGEQSMGLVKRAFTLPGRIGAAVGELTGLSWEKMLRGLEDAVVNVMSVMYSGLQKINKWTKGFFGNIGKFFFGDKEKGTDGLLGKIGKGLSSTIGGVFTVFEKLTNTGFFKGLTSASRAKKEAKIKAAAAALRANKPESKSDAELQAIRESEEQSKDYLEQIAANTDPEREQKDKDAKAAADRAKALKEAQDAAKEKKEKSRREKIEKRRADREDTKLGKILNAIGRSREKFKGGPEGGSLGLDLGKVLGGIGSGVGGLLKMLAGALTTLTGFKVLMNTITKILSSTLRPMNSAFNKFTIAIKPVLITMRNSLKAVMKTVSDICKGVIDILQPILQDVIKPFMEALGPALMKVTEAIQKTMLPILETLMKTILGPLFVRFVTTLLPAIETIAGFIEIISGAVETLVGLGFWIYGWLAHKDEMKEQGSTMMDTGINFVKQGFLDMGSSFKAMGDALLGKTSIEAQTVQKEVVEKEKPIYAPKGSIFDGVVGNGDSQANYGGYLGMNKHGCGPTALADMVSRRTGSRVSATGMASSMIRSGAYNQNAGTSVGGYISAANSMGMGLRAGGVTSGSLKRATPNNPITLVGSGSGFGTRSGNTHYVNVVGSNGSGTTFVSNPMTGRIERRSTSDLVSHSLLGLYGSGDAPSNPNVSDDGSATNTTIGYQAATGYTFPDAIQDAMDYLKDLAKSLLSIFTGPDESTIIQQQIDDQNSKRLMKDTKMYLGDEYQKYEDEARQAAYADYASKNPKKDSESDEEYEKKQEKYFQDHILSYLAATKAFEVAQQKGGDAYQNILNAYTKTKSVVSTTDWQDSAFSGAAGGDGVYGLSENVKMYPFGDPEHRSTNITSGESGESPVHDFFGKMAGTRSYSSSNYENWYQRRMSPNSEGVGKSGDSHNGIDIQWEGGNAGKPLYAITDGIVTAVRNEQNSTGNAVRWKDASDRYEHVYMHMRDRPTVKEGDKIRAGQLLGYVGNTGASGGAHLHYGIYDGSGWDSTVNPLTYWKWHKGKNATGVGGDLPGSSRRDKIWNWLVAPVTIGGLGATREGAAGVLGNMHVESAEDFEPRREEGNYSIPISDTSYADSVDAGTYSRDAFATDRTGFGLVQWTTSDHKGGLYDYLKNDKKVSIGDLRGQLEYLGGELENSDFAGVNISKDVINSLRKEGVSVYDNMYQFLTKFENPADWSGNAIIRGQHAQTIYDYYKNYPIPTTLDLSDNTIVSSYDKPPTTTTNGSGFVSGGQVQFSNAYDAEQYMKAIADTTSQLHTNDYVKFNGKPFYVRTSNNNMSYMPNPSDTIRNKSYQITQYTSYKDKSTGKTYNLYKLKDLATGKVLENWFSREGLYVSGHENTGSSSTTKNTLESMKVTQKDLDEYLNSDQYKQINAMMAKSNTSTSHSNSKIYNTSASDPITGPLWSAAGVTGKKNVTYADLAKLKGNGDFEIESFIGNGPESDIPPVNADLAFWNEMGFGTGQQASGQTVNTYNIVRTDDANADKRINAVLRNTFEIKSKSIEVYLEKILDAIESRSGRSWAETYNGQPSNTKLFDEQIPQQVAKLSIG